MIEATYSDNPHATARYFEGIGSLESFRTTRDWNELEDAERNFREAALLDQNYDAAQFYLGVAQEMIGKHEQAASQFEILLVRRQNSSPDPELLYNLGLSYFHQYCGPAYEKALEYIRTLLSLTNPERTNADFKESTRVESIRLLAESLLAQVYSHMSIVPPGTTLEQYRSEAEVNYRLAIEIANQGLSEFESKRNHLESDLVRDIGWSLHNAIGHAVLYASQRGDSSANFSNALHHFNEALRYDPENYRVLSNVGSANLFLAEFLKANGATGTQNARLIAEHLAVSKNYFLQVLQIKPQYDFAYYRLAQIAMQMENWQEAREMLKLARQHPSEMTVPHLDEFERLIPLI